MQSYSDITVYLFNLNWKHGQSYVTALGDYCTGFKKSNLFHYMILAYFKRTKQLFKQEICFKRLHLFQVNVSTLKLHDHKSSTSFETSKTKQFHLKYHNYKTENKIEWFAKVVISCSVVSHERLFLKGPCGLRDACQPLQHMVSCSQLLATSCFLLTSAFSLYIYLEFHFLVRLTFRADHGQWNQT